ncbi:MAG: methyltransferase domain-containing protein [Candidatus Thermoplasmatota archaeon]|nr:methyltransferase domain-containing protein [Candidatus Thermoplasmatota archaeon]MBU1941778.1 methyltransferase domain-containing protein [Candidatus Thermoplasmatota archaeon]
MPPSKYDKYHKRSPEELHDFIKKLAFQALETAEERLPLYLEVGVKNAKNILDVGCGAGFVSRDLANLTKGYVLGVDGSQHLLQVAQQTLKNNKHAMILQADAHHLPIKNNSFEIVTCNLLLMWADNPQKVVSEMARVTKPGGRVLASLEPDYGGKIHYPENSYVDPLFAGEAIRKKGGDPHIGRKLRALFTHAGLTTKIGIGNNRIWTCQEDKNYYSHSRDFYIKVMRDAGLSQKHIDQWEYEYLRSLDEGTQLNFFPQFYAIGNKPKT